MSIKTMEEIKTHQAQVLEDVIKAMVDPTVPEDNSVVAKITGHTLREVNSAYLKARREKLVVWSDILGHWCLPREKAELEKEPRRKARAARVASLEERWRPRTLDAYQRQDARVCEAKGKEAQAVAKGLDPAKILN